MNRRAILLGLLVSPAVLIEASAARAVPTVNVGSAVERPASERRFAPWHLTIAPVDQGWRERSVEFRLSAHPERAA